MNLTRNLQPGSPPTAQSAEEVRHLERRRIAREIHDELGGNLIGIKMALAQMARRLPSDDAVLAEHAAYLHTLVERSIEAAQRIGRDQYPSILASGIVAALVWQGREFEKQVGIACDFSFHPAHIELSPDHSLALFRIYQEALTNIAKHAKASRVVARLVRTKHGINLKISDNGCGMSSDGPTRHDASGIAGMRERALALGGKLSISAAASGGSVLVTKLPIAADHCP